MVKKATYGSVRRLGSRYGRTVRFKLGKIESEQSKKHKCPYCSYVQVRRISAGIWHCKKCKVTFSSKAYTVQKMNIVRPVEDSGVAESELENSPEEQASQAN